MSGPKIDQATLERMRREALERARLERVRKIKIATDECNKILESIKKTISLVASERREQIIAMADKSEMGLTLKRVQNSKVTLTRKLYQTMDITIPTEPEDINKLNARMRKQLQSALDEYRSATSGEYSRIDAYFSELQAQEKMKAFSEALKETSDGIVTIDFSFDKELLNKSKEVSAELREAALKTMDELADILNSEFSSLTIRATAAEYAKQISQAVHADPVALKKVINEVSLAKIRIQNDLSDLEDLYQEYLAEFVVYINKRNEFLEENHEVVPISRRAFPNRKALQDELEKLRTLSRQINEQNYIKQQINEVMEKFHYQMCEDIVLDPNQTGRHYLCESIDGKTAVHIHVSDSKQIMMEIVGTARKMRPQSSAVTAEIEALDGAEAARLLGEQGRFCSIHPMITEELRKRGVILDEKSHKKPSLDYCKKITSLDLQATQTHGAYIPGVAVGNDIQSVIGETRAKPIPKQK